MQIVIDIPDEQIEKSLAESKYIHEDEGEKGSVDIVLLYTNKKLEFVVISRKTDFYSLDDRYTILPEGHGRLIDADELFKKHPLFDTYPFPSTTIDNAPTIIKADKGEEI